MRHRSQRIFKISNFKQSIHMTKYCTILTSLILAGALQAAEYHVSKSGSDTNVGSQARPFLTISKAADIAQPGDVVTVSEGVYRERINPPRGGTSDQRRIVYQAAAGADVTIKGSEVASGWEKVEDNTYKLTLPNSFFGEFNPYDDLISGAWYEARQAYHTGAVYLDGHWLKEAARKSIVVKSQANGAGADVREELMNIEFIQPGGGGKVEATAFTSKSGAIETIELADERSAVGRMADGSSLICEMDFGEVSKNMSIHAASPISGGIVELRKDTPEGELIGQFDVGFTAEWTHFQLFHANITPISGKHTVCVVFKTRPVNHAAGAADLGYWFAEVDDQNTTIWADFKGANPNEAFVEINVRQAVFYPELEAIDYITVKGFTLEQAATPWSAPSAGQMGLIGPNWSKGWVIENNTIRYAACTAITIGKHFDEHDHTYDYLGTSIPVGIERGWSREKIGSHLIKDNHIYNCGQGGIQGSLGSAFSTIIGNEIHDIRQDHQYGGCETAGIKLHGAVDVLIADNHVYNCAHWGGIWLDWMSQGARVTGNLLHGNSNDLMFEMNHGPMLIDNNILLSNRSVLDASGGGAYVHNLIRGAQDIWPDLTVRRTPAFKPHSVDPLADPSPAGDFGAIGGGVASFAVPINDTEQDFIYQTVRYGTKGYRLNVENGNYRVILRFVEPFYDSVGLRRFGVTVQGEVVAESLDIIAEVGKNKAGDLSAEDVHVVDGVLEIGFVVDRGAPAIAGIEVISDSGDALKINCGGLAWGDFIADFVIAVDTAETGVHGFRVDQHDERFFNNLFANPRSLLIYDEHQLEIAVEGNVFLSGAKPSKREQTAIVADTFDPAIELTQKSDGWWLEMNIDPAWQATQERSLITSAVLGRAVIPDAPFVNRDGTPYRIDTDYFGANRNARNPAPGPFSAEMPSKVSVKVWPRN